MSEAAKIDFSEVNAMLEEKKQQEIARATKQAELRLERRKAEISNNPYALEEIADNNLKREIMERIAKRTEENKADKFLLVQIKERKKARRDKQREQLKSKLNKQVKNRKKNK